MMDTFAGFLGDFVRHSSYEKIAFKGSLSDEKTCTVFGKSSKVSLAFSTTAFAYSVISSFPA
jgi:hypothetical protein